MSDFVQPSPASPLLLHRRGEEEEQHHGVGRPIHPIMDCGAKKRSGEFHAIGHLLAGYACRGLQFCSVLPIAASPRRCPPCAAPKAYVLPSANPADHARCRARHFRRQLHLGWLDFIAHQNSCRTHLPASCILHVGIINYYMFPPTIPAADDREEAEIAA